MTTDPTNLAEMKQALLDQIAEELDTLPGEDFKRVCRATLAKGGGSMFRGLVFAGRELSDKRVTTYAMISHGQARAETAADLERVAEMADGDLRVKTTGRAAALQAEADALHDHARRWITECEEAEAAEGQKRG